MCKDDGVEPKIYKGALEVKVYDWLTGKKEITGTICLDGDLYAIVVRGEDKEKFTVKEIVTKDSVLCSHNKKHNRIGVSGVCQPVKVDLPSGKKSNKPKKPFKPKSRRQTMSEKSEADADIKPGTEPVIENPPVEPPPSYPPIHTLLSKHCTNYTMEHVLADGNGGSYEDNQGLSTDCTGTQYTMGVHLAAQVDGYYRGMQGINVFKKKDINVIRGFLDSFGDIVNEVPVVVDKKGVNYLVQGATIRKLKLFENLGWKWFGVVPGAKKFNHLMRYKLIGHKVTSVVSD